MIKKHFYYLYSKEEKIKWFGEGEWVEEPDKIEFSHNGFDCIVKRISIKEPFSKEEHYFGGHLCGYISIPPNHPFYGKKYSDLEIDVHGGLTYAEFENDGYWIGFDCGHSEDLVPSMAHLRELYKGEIELFSMPEEFKKYSIFIPVYRNIDFCIQECKSMAEQLKKIKDHETTPII
jgi:hypothetical protein